MSQAHGQVRLDIDSMLSTFPSQRSGSTIECGSIFLLMLVDRPRTARDFYGLSGYQKAQVCADCVRLVSSICQSEFLGPIGHKHAWLSVAPPKPGPHEAPPNSCTTESHANTSSKMSDECYNLLVASASAHVVDGDSDYFHVEAGRSVVHGSSH